MKKRKSAFLNQTFPDKAFDVVNISFLLLVGLIVLYPIVVVVSSSFSTAEEVMTGKVKLLPVGFTLDGYKAIMQHEQVWSGLYNSFYYMIVGTVIQMVITVLAAYPLSREDLVGRKIIMKLFAFTMWFGGGLIPTYMLVKNLGMINSRWALIIPAAMSVWNMVIVRSYFESSLPKELRESAEIDGCSETRYLLQIAIPLSKPVLAVVCLYYAVGQWNIFFSAYLYITQLDLQPIQVVLRDILLMNQTKEIAVDMEAGQKNELLAELLKYCLVIVSSLPMIILYPFVQKYFVKGIMVGAVKG